MPQELLGSRVAAIYELQAAWLEPRLKQIGVRWSSFQLLAAIVGAGDEASQAEIARRLAVAPATLSEAVQNHVERGWVEQVPSPRDKRLKVLRLTLQGKKLMGQVRNLVIECEHLMAAAVTPAQSTACAKVLDKMIESLERALET